MGKKYLPLEANPEVISKYVKALGGPLNMNFVDVFGIDDSALSVVPRPVVAVLLLFPLKEAILKFEDEQAKEVEASGKSVNPKIWFTKQTVGNSCGTVAILHTVANIKDKASYVKGGFFDNFFEQVKDMTPEERAIALEENEEIEKAHTAAGVEGQSRVPSASEEVDTHFIVFVEVGNRLVELDGRKKYPIDLGSTTPETLLQDAVKMVRKNFMEKDPQEVRFNLIAITTN